MKKYIAAASLFVFGNEVLSWLAIVVIAAMLLFAFLNEAGKGGMFD